MTSHVLCGETEPTPCPSEFRIRASSWVNATNIGESNIATAPPAGIRLRWNCPFVSDAPALRLGKLIKYVVQRSAPIDRDRLVSFRPTAGHFPRSPTPSSAWGPLVRLNELAYVAAGSSCTGVDAVYFELTPQSPTVRVTLVDTGGHEKVVADLRPNEAFYFEVGSLKSVVFSSAPQLVKLPIGLSVSHIGDENWPKTFKTIAEVNASSWHKQSLAQISERLSNRKGEPFVALNQVAWRKLQELGRAISEAFDTQTEVEIGVQQAMELAAGSRFDVSTLIGCGVIDGEHPSGPLIDRIVAQEMLGGPSQEVFAYRVIAQFRAPDGSTKEVPSIPCFAEAVLASLPKSVRCRTIPIPTVKASITNHVEKGPQPDKPTQTGTAEETITCVGNWEIRSELPFTELVATTPIAEDSVITGARFEDPGVFLSGSDNGILHIRGLEVVEVRRLEFVVPYFDSDVSLRVEARDTWDRRVRSSSPRKVQPDIDYREKSVPILNVRPVGKLGLGAPVEVTLDDRTPWEADGLAAYAKGKIEIYIRNPDATPDEVSVTIGPPSPAADSGWTAEVHCSLSRQELDAFIGGVLSVAGFEARIVSLTSPVNGATSCVFEAATNCARTELYVCDGSPVPARMSESLQSERLWLSLDARIDILPTRLPAKGTETCRLPSLKASTTLQFATRVEFGFEGKHYKSAFTPPCAFPYVHPAPEPPAFCFSILQIGKDFYRRELFRTQVENCKAFDETLDARLSFAPGKYSSAGDFQREQVCGLLGPQKFFTEGVMFEAFSEFGADLDGSTGTLGISLVRTEDNCESTPLPKEFVVRRLGRSF